MVCESCGRTVVNENANFCDYCGASLREQKNLNIQRGEVYQQNNTVSSTGSETVIKGEEKPITFGNWLVSMLIFFIPVVGWIIFPIMLLYWSFSGTGSQNKKNWARATIVTGIVAIIILIGYLGVGLQQLAASGMDINSYMQQFYPKP